MSPIVLDASGGVEVALRTLIGRRLGRLLSDRTVFVPEIFYSEVAGVLRRLAARDEISPERATEALDRLLTLEVRRASVKPLVPRAWELRHNVTVSDALYVTLARELCAPLVTGDRRLTGAPNLGIAVIAE